MTARLPFITLYLVLSVVYRYGQTQAFICRKSPQLGSVVRNGYLPQVTALEARKELPEERHTEESSLPLLPAFGASSSVNPLENLVNSKPSDIDLGRDNDNDGTAFVSPKFRLQYTCSVCDTRNSHMVSRMAYREGLVIAICKGCKSKHLIADNLDGKTGFDGNRNIEEYLSAKGTSSVNRVSPEVFDLENILFFDSSGGALIGEDGDPVLE